MGYTAEDAAAGKAHAIAVAQNKLAEARRKLVSAKQEERERLDAMGWFDEAESYRQAATVRYRDTFLIGHERLMAAGAANPYKLTKENAA